MTDFDFDELDKAVAGVLNADESTAQQSTQNTPVSQPTEIKPLQSEPSTTPAAAPSVAPPAARRSSGRFMDVVHPSSDMRTASSARASFTPPTPRSTEPITSDSQTAPTHSIDTANTEAESAWAKPLESPFLPDAKVEKRPLGNAHPTGEQVQSKSFEEELLLEEPDELRLEATTMPDPIDFAAQASAIDTEVEDTGELDEKSVADEEESPAETKQVGSNYGADERTNPFSSPISKEEPSYVAEAVEPTGPTSITQQYKELPSTQQESGAIYDTENYHKPVIEAAKKHHGAWAVLWIILLVILGAGAGVAFYLFVLPML